MTVEGDLTLEGSVTCDLPLDPTCFGLAVCPDFTSCDLVDNSMRHVEGMQVGQVADGIVPAPIQYVYFGRRTLWNILLLEAFANNVVLAAIEQLVLFGDDNIIMTAGPGGMFLNSGDRLRAVAQDDVLVQSVTGNVTIAALAQGISLLTSNTISMSAADTLISTTSWSIEKTPSDKWIDAVTADTQACPNGAPLAVGDSIRVHKDLIIKDDRSIMADATTSLWLNAGPFLRVCGSVIAGQNNELTIGENNDTLLYVHGTIYSADNETCVDIDGCLDLTGPISNSASGVVEVASDLLAQGDASVDGTLNADTISPNAASEVTVTAPLHVDTLNANVASEITSTSDLLVASGSTFKANAIEPATGSLVTLTGDLTVTGDVNCAGGTCSSDMRFKHSIESVSPEASLERIAKLEVIKFGFKAAFGEARGIAETERFLGFSAQAVDKVVPQAIRKLPLKVGEELVKDFHTLRKQELVPDLVGAVHALLAKTRQMAARIESLESTLRVLHQGDGAHLVGA